MPAMRPSRPSRTWPLLRSVLLPMRSNAAHGPQRVVVGLVLVQREVVLLEVGLHERLHRADAQRAIAQDRVGHEVPAERLRQLEGRDLTMIESGREVPQWPLAPPGLVDRARRVVAAPNLAEVGRVRAPRHAAEHRELTVLQHGCCVVPGRQFIRGHGCPSGSTGKPQKRHGGRPEATSARLWCTNAHTCARLRRTFTDAPLRRAPRRP